MTVASDQLSVLSKNAGAKTMSRKICIWLLAALLLTNVSALAQQPAKVPRIGFESDSPATSIAARVEGFRHGLRELGYVEG